MRVIIGTRDQSIWTILWSLGQWCIVIGICLRSSYRQFSCPWSSLTLCPSSCSHHWPRPMSQTNSMVRVTVSAGRGCWEFGRRKNWVHSKHSDSASDDMPSAAARAGRSAASSSERWLLVLLSAVSSSSLQSADAAHTLDHCTSHWQHHSGSQSITATDIMRVLQVHRRVATFATRYTVPAYVGLSKYQFGLWR